MGGVLKSSDGVESALRAQNGLLRMAALSIGGRLAGSSFVSDAVLSKASLNLALNVAESSFKELARFVVKFASNWTAGEATELKFANLGEQLNEEAPIPESSKNVSPTGFSGASNIGGKLAKISTGLVGAASVEF